MFCKSNWKEPIYKNDLIGVLLNGFLAALLGGILGGLVDYLLTLWNVPLSFSVLVVLYLVIWRVKKGFYSNHILYALLGIVFLLFGIWVTIYTNYAIVYILAGNYKIYEIFIYPGLWLEFITKPVSTLILGIRFHDFLAILFGILNVLFYIWALPYVYFSIKGRR